MDAIIEFTIAVISSFYFLIAIMILMVFLCEKDDYFYLTWIGFIASVLSVFSFSKSIVGIETVTWLFVAGFVLFYIVGGLVWVNLRWRFWCSKQKLIAQKYVDCIKENTHLKKAELEMALNRVRDGQFSLYFREHKSPSEVVQEEFKSRVHPIKNMGRILKWIFMWPLSMVSYLASDLVDFVEIMVRKYLIEQFKRISAKYDTAEFDAEFEKLSKGTSDKL